MLDTIISILIAGLAFVVVYGAGDKVLAASRARAAIKARLARVTLYTGPVYGASDKVGE